MCKIYDVVHILRSLGTPVLEGKLGTQNQKKDGVIQVELSGLQGGWGADATLGWMQNPGPALFFPFSLAGIPLLGFLFLLPLTIPWARISVAWLGIAHYLACIFPQLGSVLYHLFMNHEGGPAVYHTLLTLDMCGICMVNTLGEFQVPFVE